MPARLRGPQRVSKPGIRFPFHAPFFNTPLTTIELVFTRNDNTDFQLSPVQDRYSTGERGTVERDSVEWHLPCESSFRCQLRATSNSLPAGDFYSFFEISLQDVLHVDLGGQENAGRSNTEVNLFTLLRGSIAVPLPPTIHSSFEPVFDAMWPTGNRGHIKYLMFEPRGLYAAGFLPNGIYGNKEQQLVVLRVPQNQTHNAAEAEWEWTNFCFPPLNVDGRTEPLTPLTASRHIKQHADALRAFSPRNSFIDDVKYQQSQNGRIQVAREVVGSRVESIVWTANQLSTTIVLGTATSPEAQFSAVTVKGEIKRLGGVPDAWDGENTVWKSSSIAGERVESFDELADDRSFTLTLTRTPDTSGPREPKIAIHLNDMLVATSVPLRDMNGTSGERIQRGTAWLCTKDGWLAIDRTQVMAPTAVPLAPRSPMSGLIDVDRMRHDFDRNGIQLGVKLRVGALANDSQVSLRHTVTSLSLTISNPTTFLSMQSLWANATDDNQIPPEITPIPPKTDESKKHLPLGPPTDSMMNERFSGAEFVTVSKPDSDADGDGLIIKVALSDAFRITLPSGRPKPSRYTLWRAIPRYPLAQNMPTSLPDEGNRFMATNRGFIPFRIADGLDVKVGLDGPLPCVIEDEDRIKVAFDAQQLPSDLFLTTLPGFGIDLSSKAPEKWHYRHASPVLDEEFARVAESTDESRSKLSDVKLDLTRVVGSTGFVFDCADGMGTAQVAGWLHRTKKDNPDGAATVEWSNARLHGRSPSIDLSIANKTVLRQFYRRAPEFVRLQAGGNETDEVQMVSIPTGWIEIRITLGTQTTGTIPYESTDSQIEKELWTIVGQNNANVVSSTDKEGRTITVTFAGELAKTPQHLLALKRHVSELSAALKVTATKRPDGMPEFSVQFAPDSPTDPSKNIHRIVHNGQPLITCDNFDEFGVSAENRRIFTLDADGKVCEEPVNGRSRHYHCNGDASQICAAETVVLFPLLPSETENTTAMTIELCGVEIGDSFATASCDPFQQRWQLHDGAYGWPRLLGFYLRPLKLLRIDLDHAGRIKYLHITATLLQGKPTDASPPVDAYGEIQLSFYKELSNWRIKTSSQESTIDWHFTVAEDTVSLLRLTGKIPANSEIMIRPDAKLSWRPDRVVIQHKAGMIDLVDQRDPGDAIFNGDMCNGKITFWTTKDIEPDEQNNLRASLEKPTMVPPNIKGNRLRVVELENYKFTWSPILGQYKADLIDDGRKWSLKIPAAHIETGLKCYTLGRGRLLLGTMFNVFQPQLAESGGPLLRKASDQPDVGFILAAFSPNVASHCQSLSGRILTHLVDSELGWDSRVSADLLIEDNGEIQCRISGWIHAPNAIQFQDEHAATIEHNMRVIFDQVLVPLECIFDGILKGDDDVEVAAVVEHCFIFPGTPVGRRFQVPQLVQLTTVKRHLLRVLNKNVDDNSCLIDLSTTSCWQLSEKHPQATGRSDIDDGFLALNFSTRKSDLCNTGLSHELRLPAMVGIHRDRNGHRFTIEGHAGVVVPDSPTTNYSFASLGVQAQTYADFVTQTAINFDRRRYLAFGNEPERGTFVVDSSGYEIHMHGNLWKATRFPCMITSSTVLEFDFKSGQEGQRHGIGFSKTLTPSQKQWAQVWGSQQDGTFYRIEPQYDGSGNWNHFRIPIGRLMPGSFEYLVFICDHDVPRPDGDSRFRNVKLYDVPIALKGEFSKRGQTAMTLRHDELLKSLKRPHASHVFDYLSSVPVFLEGNDYHFIPNKLPDLAMLRDASIDAHIEAQTVVRTHQYEQFPQPMTESTVVHFPHEIFTEASQDPGGNENVFDCQLLTFVGNRTRLIAHERVANDAGLGKEKTVIGWAQRILESRRIGEGGLVIKDYKSLIHVTRPSGGAKSLSSSLGAYQTFGLTQQFTSATQDPRCRYPDSDLTNGLQADPTMDLLLFESKVDLPSAGQSIVAATRSRVVGTWFGNVWRYHAKDFTEVPGQLLAYNILQNLSHRVWRFLGKNNLELFERVASGELDPDDSRIIASEINLILQITALSGILKGNYLEINERCFYNRKWLEDQFSGGPTHDQIPKVHHSASVRPARSALLATTKDATIQGDTISLTRWQNTEFEICRRKESPYPSVDPKPILHRSASPVSGLLLPGEALRTVLPPVTEISCWQARPGELSRETWDLNRISFENQSQRVGSSIVAAATLRKPRAVAGNSEAVELQLEEHKALFSDTRWRDQKYQKYRFHYARLRLSQILGASETPSEITGVLTTEKQFYPAVENPRLAENRPVMANYVPPSKETDSEPLPPSPETLRLFLFAQESFLPTETTKIWVEHSVNGQKIEIEIPEMITVLAYDFNNSIGNLSDSKVFPELDDNSSADFFFDDSKSVVYSNPIGSLLRLAGPSDKDSIWKLLDNKVYALDYSISSQEMILKELYETPPRRIFIGVRKFKLAHENPNKPGTWRWTAVGTSSVVFEHVIQFLDMKSSIIVPRTAVSLLAWPRKVDSSSKLDLNGESCALAGFGRLADRDFSQIEPRYRPLVDPDHIQWLRTGQLQTVLRNDALDMDNGKCPFEFDVVVNGPGGELIPTAIP